MTETVPMTLAAAIATEPWWLQTWVIVLTVANLAAFLFLAHRFAGHWRLRREALAIIVAMIAAVILINWLFVNVGYVRLLGLAHLIAWTPAWVFVAWRREHIGIHSAYGIYIHFYLLTVGISLLIDAIDVLRYLLGDGELYLRWAAA